MKMKNQRAIAHSLLWAAAIIASAIVKAPPLLTLILLPGLSVAFVRVSYSPAKPACAGAGA
jgi:hypothetical protein